jgi:hypothetical protein
MDKHTFSDLVVFPNVVLCTNTIVAHDVILLNDSRSNAMHVYVQTLADEILSDDSSVHADDNLHYVTSKVKPSAVYSKYY